MYYYIDLYMNFSSLLDNNFDRSQRKILLVLNSTFVVEFQMK